MALTNREKVLLFILTFTIVVGSFLYFLIFPMIDRIKENTIVIEQEGIILQDLQQASKTGTLTEIEKKIDEETIRIEAILPTQVRYPEVYLVPLSIANRTGIDQQSYTMQTTRLDVIASDTDVENAEEGEQQVAQQPSEQLLIIPFNHKFNGTYQEIQNYMKEIQESERKIDIMEYQIMNNSEEGGNELSASFLLQSYALVEEGQNYSEFVEYDFIQGNYGRNNPFGQGAFTEVEEVDIIEE